MEIIANKNKNSTGKVSKRFIHTRENAIIPWNWIVDETHLAGKSLLRGPQAHSFNASLSAIDEILARSASTSRNRASLSGRCMVKGLHQYKNIVDELNWSNKPSTAFYCGDFDSSDKLCQM